ncbi:MAG: DUF2062 domain-containing protein [Thiotrichales bacterium]
MPKRFFRRFLPHPHVVRTHPNLKSLARWLHDPNLWHLNRHSVSMAFAVGLLWAFIPMPPFPGQMFFAALTAIWLRVNLPISMALVWLTNPITMPPVFYGAYKLGEWLLDLPPSYVDFELSSEWFTTVLFTIWKPFLLGSAVIATTASILGYWVVQLFWRIHVVRDYRARQRQRRDRRASKHAEIARRTQESPAYPHQGPGAAIPDAATSRLPVGKSDRAGAPKPGHV